MTEVQIVSWRDIPAQVKARRGRDRAARVLSQRFQDAIDAAAMRAGLTETEAYLGEWRASNWEEQPGTPEEAAERRAAELEREYSDERLAALVERGGRKA